MNASASNRTAVPPYPRHRHHCRCPRPSLSSSARYASGSAARAGSGTSDSAIANVLAHRKVANAPAVSTSRSRYSALLWYPLSPTASWPSRSSLVAKFAGLLQILVGSVRALLDRRRVPLRATVQCHRHHRSRLRVDRVLLLVAQVRAAVLHLRDLRVRIVCVHQLRVRPLLPPFAVDARQILSRRRRAPGCLRQVPRKLLVAAEIFAPHDRARRRVRLQRRPVDADRLPLSTSSLLSSPEHPREDLLVRLLVDQPGAFAKSSSGPAAPCLSAARENPAGSASPRGAKRSRRSHHADH